MAIFASSAVRLLIGLTIALSFIAFFTPTSVTEAAISFRMPIALKNLDVSIEQVEKDPVLLRATVTNNNDGPVTILTYGSPLDPLGISLGILSITPKGESTPLEIMTIEASRLWPPAEDALIEIQPGKQAIWDCTLQEPVVPMDRVFEGATVQLKGTWNAVWTKEKKNVDYTHFEEGTPKNETLTGPFKSNVIDIEVA
ncbi:hypothetical protein F53441_13533 [Fusarium austroafricanum]|uniref:Uncharacterized protein n=1 Tax=Fusarium austroafricanum TaxID=2364996 RepID=A0A8H4JNA5_9HYPO|nr:hypothetical protein F53441_13533 [Fusarium austroafricanum]